MASELDSLLAGLDEAFQRRAWHGTNLLGSLRSITPAQAAWRPDSGRHNVWELVVHAAYWKYAVARRLSGAKRGSFPLPGSNWFVRDGGSAADLRSDLDLLKTCHRHLLDAARSLRPGNLGRRPGNGRFTAAELLRGAAAHDLYHAGQIQLLKRLRGAR
jgi:uncharacterized damage-inducible protein DinB